MKKRGLPEGYVRGLEKLWGLAIRDVDEVEENVLSALAGDDESKRFSISSPSYRLAVVLRVFREDSKPCSFSPLFWAVQTSVGALAQIAIKLRRS